MAEKTALDVFRFELFPQERIGLEIDHSKSEILARTPISVDALQLREV